MARSFVVVGAAGFLGAEVVRQLAAAGHRVTGIDRQPMDWADSITADLLVDDLSLPPGDVIVAAGSSQPRVRHPWTIALDNAITTARLLPHLAGRQVVLASSVEVLGAGAGPTGRPGGLPRSEGQLRDWCDRAVRLAGEPCPPWRMAALCRELVDADGRWTYGLAKRAQEILLDTSAARSCHVVRLANLFGPGQDRVISRLARRASAGLELRVTDTVRCFVPVADAARAVAARAAATPAAAPGATATVATARSVEVCYVLGSPLPLVRVAELTRQELSVNVSIRVEPVPAADIDARALAARADTGPDAIAALEGAVRRFVRQPAVLIPPLAVVIPPRPERPDQVAERHQASLWSGQLKDGRWSRALAAALRQELDLPDGHGLVLCASGTAALRMAVVATAGMAAPGSVAVLPSFTFPATAEALVQLGYRLRFVDVDPLTWTLDPHALAPAVADGRVGVVVSVDTLGAPADYAALNAVCARAGVALVADSAPGLGSRYGGRPLGTQAAAHAYSMSFAKVVSAGGTGGALVLPTGRLNALGAPVDWLRSATLGELPAATALDQVEALHELVARRSEVAAVYAEFAADRPDVVTQQVRARDRHSWVHWVGRFIDVDRDALQAELAARGVASKAYYAPALHRHDWAGAAEPAPELAVTSVLDREALALPMSSELTGEDAERVVGALVSALAAVRPRRAAYRDRPTRHVRPMHVLGPAVPAMTKPAGG